MTPTAVTAAVRTAAVWNGKDINSKLEIIIIIIHSFYITLFSALEQTHCAH